MFDWVLNTPLVQFYDILTFRFFQLNMSGEVTQISNVAPMNRVPWERERERDRQTDRERERDRDRDRERETERERENG